MILAPLAFAAGLAAFQLPSGTDTTLVVPRDVQLSVADYSGEVFIQTWNRDAVRILADTEDEDRLVVEPSENVLLIKARPKSPEERSATIRLTVPTWMDLDVSGIHTDVIITGTEGAVKVETVHGDVVVQGGRRRIRLNTVDDDIALSGAIGTIAAQTVNGSAYVYRVRSDSVDVSTVNGAIAYDGTIADKGAYRFTSHNGDVAVAIPRETNAGMAISTFSGDFESAFPVTLTETKGGRSFNFCLGTCSARVDLASFDGTIRLYRAESELSEQLQRIDRIVDRIVSTRTVETNGRQWMKAFREKRKTRTERTWVEQGGAPEKHEKRSDPGDGR
ncbi:MAG: DUF4097 family beta strand repeat-containing protein [Hyphomicrobiales bacterium]